MCGLYSNISPRMCPVYDDISTLVDASAHSGVQLADSVYEPCNKGLTKKGMVAWF